MLTPDIYYQTEEQFFNSLKDVFGGDLLFYCTTGSSGRKDVIPEWSDIDTIFVFENWEEDTLRKIDEVLSRNKTSIKIGTTFYSLSEFNSRTHLDPKTFNALRHIQRGVYAPRVADSRVDQSPIAEEEYKTMVRVNFTEELHAFKRELLLYPRFDEKKAYKMLTIILRALLLEKGIEVEGYHAIWGKAEALGLELPVITPEIIMQRPQEIDQRYRIYLKLLFALNQ